MRRGARQSSTIAAVAVSMMLAVTACTGGNDADPTSEVPLTPGGSVINESTSSETTSPSALPGTTLTQSGTTQPSASPSSRSTRATGPMTTPKASTSPRGTPSPTTTAPTSTGPPSTPPTSIRPSTGPTSPTSATVPSRSSDVETLHLTPEELNTRKDIEKAWLKYWDVFVTFNKVPKDQRKAVFSAVAMDPDLSSLIQAATKADEAHIENFGTVGHHVYWGPPVSGKSSAVIGDCTDQSRFGYRDSKTKEIQGVGTKSGNYNGTMQKGSDGIWRVSFRDRREGVPCPS